MQRFDGNATFGKSDDRFHVQQPSLQIRHHCLLTPDDATIPFFSAEFTEHTIASSSPFKFDVLLQTPKREQA